MDEASIKKQLDKCIDTQVRNMMKSPSFLHDNYYGNQINECYLKYDRMLKELKKMNKTS